MSRFLFIISLFSFSLISHAGEELSLNCVRNVNSQLELKVHVSEGCIHLMFIKGDSLPSEPIQRAFVSSEQIYPRFVEYDLEGGGAHLLLNAALLKKEISQGLLFYGESYEKSYSCSVDK